MQTLRKMTGAQFDSMVARGAFDDFGPMKIELIDGELRIMSPAGPIHDDYTNYVMRWSSRTVTDDEFEVRSLAGVACDDDRPEPDVMWLRPGRYGRRRPDAADVRLGIEVSDSSLAYDLNRKADLYAARGVHEYWVVDVQNRRVHVMNDSDGKTYRSIEIHAPPTFVSPRCKPEAKLALSDLFEIE